MKDIAIYGAGGLGREVACLIHKINSHEKRWNFVGFFDDGKEKDSDVLHYGKILGGIEELNAWTSPLDIVIAIGSPKYLQIIHENISNSLVEFPNIIDPSFSIADETSFSIGKGNIVKSQCMATTNIKIGNFNILNGRINIGHDALINSYNVFMPGVFISGETVIGKRNLFGAGSFIKQQLKIGDDVTLSPLSALLTKPKNGCVYIGNPAKIFKF